MLRLKEKFNQDGEDLDDFCPCCHFPHEGELFPLCCNQEELAELGAGFSLYYSMGKWLVTALILTFVVAGGYCMYRNYDAANMSDETIKSNWILRGSLANYGDIEPSILEPILHLVVITLLLVLHTVVSIRHEQLETQLDLEEITPSDFTLEVSNLPKQGVTDQELTDYMQFAGSNMGKKCTVVKINWAYQIHHFVAACKKHSLLKERLGEIRSLKAQNKIPRKGGCCCIKGKEETEEEYRALVSDQKALIAELEAAIQQQLTGVAFVTFSEPHSMHAVKRALGKPKSSKGWTQFLWTLFPCLQKKRKRTFKGQILEVKRAPDPSDIIWENLGVSFI